MGLRSSGARMPEALWQPVAADWIPLYIKISDPGDLDLKAWCLDAWMLAGLEWIGGGDGGDGILGRGDWKKFSHARARGARRIHINIVCWDPPPLLGDNPLHHKLAPAKARAIYEC